MAHPEGMLRRLSLVLLALTSACSSPYADDDAVSTDGAFITHVHLDPVHGLTDVPKGSALFAGPGEKDAHGLNGLAFGGAIDGLLEGHDLREVAFGDVFGDGSFYAMHMPGHSPGSTAYLARTTKGPVLFVGDCSHTIWGWEHD